MKPPDVHAAGAVVLRDTTAGREVLLVHRPRYNDWSLPKGKLDRGETDALCAVREVEEETGARVRLTAPLTPDHYQVPSGVKRVDWWVAQANGGRVGSVIDTREVDEVAWIPVTKATKQLSYVGERDRVDEALALPSSTPLLIVRHAKALARKDWTASDSERPITNWGRRQACALVPLLQAFGVQRVVSSSATRCLQTVSPYARAMGLALEGWRELTEETGGRDPEMAGVVMAELAAQTAASGRPTVVCGHRPVLPAMLAAIGAPAQEFATAETLMVALNSEGMVVASRNQTQRIGR